MQDFTVFSKKNDHPLGGAMKLGRHKWGGHETRQPHLGGPRLGAATFGGATTPARPIWGGHEKIKKMLKF